MGILNSDLQLESNAFKSGEAIPERYAHSGENISPELHWYGLPSETQSIVLFCHDPDAPKIAPGYHGFLHWLIYNIPLDVSSLEEGTTSYTQATNDFGEKGYGGPKPPQGHGVHHYYFCLLALNLEADLPPVLEFSNLFKVIEPHVIGMNRLVGTFSK